MAVYAVGDIQGCYQPLKSLLKKINFNEQSDTLWLAGDLVNRGPRSLDVLRFVQSLGERAITVLGNHDLHLIAVAYGHRKHSKKDTLDGILNAPDADELIDWLRRQKLAHLDTEAGYFMSHAGIPPCWSVQQALDLAGEVERCLQSEHIDAYLQAMYGNEPDTWSDSLQGVERLRTITNYLTRMRFCDANGRLDLETKEGADKAIKGFAPWFSYHNPSLDRLNLLFGHWAALEGKVTLTHVHALDTGCVWGSRLRAMRLDDKKLFHCDC